MMLLRGVFCLLLCIEAVSCAGLLRRIQDRLQLARKKINTLLKGEGHDLPLDATDLEYPKADAALRKIYQKQWNEYYDCLKNQLEDTGAEQTIRPTVLMVLEGTSATLKCNLCVSPTELHTSVLIEWLYNRTGNASNDNAPIETSEHVILTTDDRDLRLDNIQSTEAGIYWCEMEGMASAPYYVHVTNEQIESTRPVHPETSNKAENYPTPPENLDKYGLRVFSLWSPWSPCSTCDKVGQRMRYGYCMISLIENGAHSGNEGSALDKRGQESGKENEKKDDDKENEIEQQDRKQSMFSYSYRNRVKRNSDKPAGETGESDSSKEEKNRKSPKELKDLARTILPIFRNRLPCRSPQTPKDIRKIDEIGGRPTEIMTGLCKIKCKKEEIFEVRDESGNVLESANNSAGFFSMMQGIPEPRPPVKRTTIYHTRGKTATLRCPGNLNAGVPVVWKAGTKVIVPSATGNDTNERMSINARRQIVIKKLRYADSNVYSCWQRGELAGTIRLQVSQAIELQIDHRVFMIGAIIIVSVMLTVFFRAFRGRKRFTIH